MMQGDCRGVAVFSGRVAGDEVGSITSVKSGSSRTR
jgi:hypothetical protein